MKFAVACLSLLLTANAHAELQQNAITDLIARGQFEQAYETASEWQEREPNSAEAAYWAGMAAGRMAMTAGMFKAIGYAKESRTGFARAIELDAGHFDAQFALMQYYVMAPGVMGGDDDEAQAIGDRLIAGSPEGAHLVRAFRLARDKDAAGALEQYRALLKLDPAHDTALGAVVGNHLEKKDFAGAKALLDAAAAVDAESPTVRYQQVKFAAMSGEGLPEALATVDALIAIRQYPENFPLAGAYWRRGQILKALDRKDEAVAAIEAGLKVAPEAKFLEDELKALKDA